MKMVKFFLLVALLVSAVFLGKVQTSKAGLLNLRLNKPNTSAVYNYREPKPYSVPYTYHEPKILNHIFGKSFTLPIRK
jgi:hypothetical protein